MVTINIASFVWLLVNTIGLFYGLRVSKKYRIAYRDVRDYKEKDAEAILFQARQNRRLALTATGCIFVFWIAGIVSLFVRMTNPFVLIEIIQYALVLGDILAVLIVYFLDTGWDRLRSIVGGRRETDKLGDN